MVDIPSHIKEHIKFLAGLLTEETNWLSVKKQLLLVLSPRDRKNFSTREQKSKRHFAFSAFENAVRDHWQLLTGNRLQMPIEKQLEDVDPAGYL